MTADVATSRSPRLKVGAKIEDVYKALDSFRRFDYPSYVPGSLYDLGLFDLVGSDP